MQTLGRWDSEYLLFSFCVKSSDLGGPLKVLFLWLGWRRKGEWIISAVKSYSALEHVWWESEWKFSSRVAVVAVWLARWTLQIASSSELCFLSGKGVGMFLELTSSRKLKKWQEYAAQMPFDTSVTCLNNTLTEPRAASVSSSRRLLQRSAERQPAVGVCDAPGWSAGPARGPRAWAEAASRATCQAITDILIIFLSH